MARNGWCLLVPCACGGAPFLSTIITIIAENRLQKSFSHLAPRWAVLTLPKPHRPGRSLLLPSLSPRSSTWVPQQFYSTLGSGWGWGELL